MVIKRVGPLSLAKIAAILYAVVGIIAGLIVSAISMAGVFGTGTPRGAGIAAFVGGGAIIVFPILYAVLGSVGALIVAGLYNLAAAIMGGIEMEVE
jgi:hypothetical protein